MSKHSRQINDLTLSSSVHRFSRSMVIFLRLLIGIKVPLESFFIAQELPNIILNNAEKMTFSSYYFIFTRGNLFARRIVLNREIERKTIAFYRLKGKSRIILVINPPGQLRQGTSAIVAEVDCVVSDYARYRVRYRRIDQTIFLGLILITLLAISQVFIKAIGELPNVPLVFLVLVSLLLLTCVVILVLAAGSESSVAMNQLRSWMNDRIEDCK